MSDIPNDATKGAVIVARHGERIDYVLRDADQNWIPTAPRPWDPPLTSRGRMQGRRLGTYLSKVLKEKGLPPVTAIYSSPMVRCCQTAAEAAIGLTTTTTDDDGGGGDSGPLPVQVRVEPGLVESMNEDWYRAWCLSDSDGTWGGPARTGADEGFYGAADDEKNIDPRARLPAHSLVWGPNEIAEFLVDEVSVSHSRREESDGSDVLFLKNDDLAALINVDAAENDAVYPIQDQPYRYGVFESRESQQDRMEKVVQSLSERYPNQTVMLLSHGGPVTHVCERLTGSAWSGQQMSTYASFSIYTPPSENDDNLWKAVVTNESCHVSDMDSVDHNASFV